MRSSAGHGRANAADDDCFIGPLSAWAAPGTPGVIYCHGVNQSCLNARSSSFAGQFQLVNALAATYAVATTDNGGPATWGNDTSATAVGNVRTWLQSTWGARSGTVALVGASMGATVALNFARANPTLVSCVVVVIPVCDLNDVVTNNRGGFAASVNTAYGTYNDATQGPTHSPVQYASTFTVPVLGYYASDDPVAVPSAAQSFDTACAAATFNSVGALGHSEAAIAAVPTADVLAFITAHT